MTNDLKKKIDEVEAQAKKLAEDLALNPSENVARIRTAKNRIAEIELKLLKEGKNGNAYFPLLTRFNGVIPMDIFVNDFHDVLISVLEKYDPSKGIRFSTFFSNALNKRAISSYDKFVKWKESTTLLLDESGEPGKEPDTNDPPEEWSPELKAFFTVASVIAKIKKYNDSLKTNGRLGEKESIWFERFFTYYTTKAVKEEGEYAEIVVIEVVNNVLFPLMEILMLRFLILYEDFKHMRDVVNNKLRREDIFNNYAKTTSECYKAEKGASKKTVINRHKAYRAIMKMLRKQTEAEFETY